MSFLIDTDIIIYSIKGDKTVQSNFIRFENIPKYISVITYGELLLGAKKSDKKEKNLSIAYKIRDIFPVINIDKAIIETFSDIKSVLQKSGKTLDDMDILIASTAMSMNLTLVTNNDKHFTRIDGLKTANWSIV